ncbi:XRE family transcriptional regulator, partial [Klebsiella pneumoniae]|nr:XRE family transcriptional regulator [Klebsiella pneumoniae]
MQNNIGSRLREERERLGLSQQALGEIGGVKKLTQLNYEKGDRAP